MQINTSIIVNSFIIFFFKVGSGYSKKELAEFNKKLAEHWKVFNKKSPPSSIILASGFKEKPDAYIEPKNSCIVQVVQNYLVDRTLNFSSLKTNVYYDFE